jgi:hypothetical protein
VASAASAQAIDNGIALAAHVPVRGLRQWPYVYVACGVHYVLRTCTY